MLENDIGKTVLRAEGLTRRLGEGLNRTDVLRGINLTLQRGSTYAIVGPSGCGKSTLLYLLGLLDRPDTGRIFLGNQRVDNMTDAERTRVRGRHIGFVFQFHFLLAEFTAEENIMMPMLRQPGVDRLAASRRARELLDLVGLGNKAARNGHQLSGGERQRVAVARALANEPDLLLADEPTGNLDYQNSISLFEQLQSLAREHDRTVLVVTHNLDLARACDHCLHMRDGVFETAESAS